MQIELTTQLVNLKLNDKQSVVARVWDGHTEEGLGVRVYVVRMSFDEEAAAERFQSEMEERDSAGMVF